MKKKLLQAAVLSNRITEEMKVFKQLSPRSHPRTLLIEAHNSLISEPGSGRKTPRFSIHHFMRKLQKPPEQQKGSPSKCDVGGGE